jgi:hypothetical protein
MRIPGINFGSVLKKQLDGGLIAKCGCAMERGFALGS